MLTIHFKNKNGSYYCYKIMAFEIELDATDIDFWDNQNVLIKQTIADWDLIYVENENEKTLWKKGEMF